jgi:ATP-dependent Clp protease protease subunit
MPIGVPRIIYCWGEELPAQWTDIYNFIFRRRMVFLMQYLDDELCNQICGLLINIHMEDRSKELEKKEMERSGVFKSGQKQSNIQKGAGSQKTEASFYNKKQRSMEDLLNADEDLGIEEIDTLEQLTLQKITTEWLNWNAQFFDYSDEPYLFYLAELLSKDFNNNEARSPFVSRDTKNGNSFGNKEMAQLLQMLKTNSAYMNKNNRGNDPLNVYSPFRTYANFSPGDFSLKDLNTLSGKDKLLKMFQSSLFKNKDNKKDGTSFGEKDKAIYKLLSDLSKKEFTDKLTSSSLKSQFNKETAFEQFAQSSEKALSQRNLRRDYNLESNLSSLALDAMQKMSKTKGNAGGLDSMLPKDLPYKNGRGENFKSFSYLDPNMSGSPSSDPNEFRSYYRKQTERALIEEESKKVFVIINSFGGSVGNGVTVHDALQFIKAGSLTLGLGVAASAASLALAGGTIGERYVTEGCHVMIHQPEGGLQGQASDIWIDSQEIMKIRLDVAEIYSLSTYRPRHKILRDLDRDFYLTASETIYYGLADEIATNEVMHDIIEMTSKVWDYHDSKQQRLLESRESASSGLDTQTQN